MDIEPKITLPKENPKLSPEEISKAISREIPNLISTQDISKLLAEKCAHLITEDPQMDLLAGRVAVSDVMKTVPSKYSQAIMKCQCFRHKEGFIHSLYDWEVCDFITNHRNLIDNAIKIENNYGYGFLSFKVLEKSYLWRVNDSICETPEMMLMRVACGIHHGDIQAVLKTYKSLSEKKYIHATPTLFNASRGDKEEEMGNEDEKPPTFFDALIMHKEESKTKKNKRSFNQLSSCFLLSMKSDSIEGIYDTMKNVAILSKFSGGIGLNINKIRSVGSYIKGTGGNSKGLLKMAKVYNESGEYVDQGGGKRNASYALYIEPWHADVFRFLEMKRNVGVEEEKSRSLFNALMIPDLFFERAINGKKWTLFDPKSVPKLVKGLYGKEFKKQYEEYENNEKIKKTQVYAFDLLFKIFISEVETGGPYLLAKDTINELSNQKHSGFIFNSNLCCEIMERTSENEISVCNLSSVNLKKCLEQPPNTNGKPPKKTFSFTKLFETVRELVYNLNAVLEKGFLPLEEASKTNKNDMPIGIGIQAFADVLIEMELSWFDEESRQLNREIAETMYFAALTASNEIARENNSTYKNYPGSPLSKGIFHWEMWKERFPSRPLELSGRWDWEELRRKILHYGVANSLLIALMPSASTSQIFGNNECIEPYASNIFVKRLLAGEFKIVCKKLVEYLKKEGLWNEEMKNKIIRNEGSIQDIKEIPARIREIYMTAYEIPMELQIDYVSDRQPFVDQGISFNHWFNNDIDFDSWTTLIHYAWESGLKTLQYYHRSKPVVSADKVTLDPVSLFQSSESGNKSNNSKSCQLVCDSCGI